jgi:hypothetical protein
MERKKREIIIIAEVVRLRGLSPLAFLILLKK